MRILLASLLLAASATAGAAQTDDRRPPLFVLQDDDSKVYLLGSVHVVPEGTLPLPNHVEEAYAEASVLAFELDLDAAQAGAQGMMVAATDEETIAESLSQEQKTTLNDALTGLGLPAGAFDTFEPWFGGMTFGVLALQQSGLPVQAGGVDAHFFDRAKTDGKERIAFETVELQTAAFDDLSTESQVAFLMESVSSPVENLNADFAALLDAWATGNDDRLAGLMSDGMTSPDVFEALLVTRNRAWIPQIESLLARDETAFVVVGAGHLVGEGSVVEMLREAGYTVERL
ncbi:MAG: TraB/GumN family protein [Bacteroidota bacterium]